MKTLFLVRHAKSSRDDTRLPDKDRPLNDRGKRDAPKMGKRLAKRDVRPELILSSPAMRALTTAEMIAKKLDYKLKEIVVDDRLYPGDADEMLTSATRSTLRVAEQNNLHSIAFPAISTGVFGYPIDKCAHIMLREAIQHFMQPNIQLERIVFCLFGQDAYQVFERELERQTAQI